MLSAVVINTSTASNLIIISQLHHFTFVSALLLPVLRLNLTLPLRLQGLGTGGWLDLTRQDFPAIYNQLTKASRVFSARTIFLLYLYSKEKTSKSAILYNYKFTNLFRHYRYYSVCFMKQPGLGLTGKAAKSTPFLCNHFAPHFAIKSLGSSPNNPITTQSEPFGFS